MDKFWKSALAVGGLAAIGAFVFWALYKQWLSLPIFSAMSADQTFFIMMIFLFLTFFIAVMLILVYLFGRTNKQSNSNNSGQSSKWPELDFEQIRKQSRLVVIDDGIFNYIDLFKRDQYQIEKWDDIIDLGKLESGQFDIILLDIQGVGLQHSPTDQGLGVIRHLRKVAPSQIIIAFSSAEWSLKYQDFFKMADYTLAKGADYVDFKRVVDDFLKKRYSLEFYLNKIDTSVNAKLESKSDLNAVATKAILANHIESLQSYLELRLDDSEAVKETLAHARVAIKVCKVGRAMAGA